MDNWVVIVASVVAVLAMTVALAIVDIRMLPAAPMARSLLLSGLIAVTAIVIWLGVSTVVAPAAAGDLQLPIAALAGMAAFLATIAVRAGGAGPIATVLFAALWTVLVFVPVAIMIFTPVGVVFGLQPIDHGGALVVNVAAGAAALGVLVVSGPRTAGLRAGTLSLRTGVLAMILLSVGWLAWLSGAELAVDEVTLGILVNGVVGALCGIGGWLLVQTLRHERPSLNAVAAGLVSGLVAVTAGAPLFTPVSAGVTGFIAGVAACIVTLRRVKATRRQQWYIVGSHFVGGAVGMIMLALLATGFGFLYTGQLVLIRDQIVSSILVGLYSAAVAAGLWFVLRRVGASL